jgi:hypothetical protein
LSKLLTHCIVLFVCIFVCIFVGACENTSSVIKTDIYGVKYAKDLLRAAIEAGIKDKALGQQALRKLLLTEAEVRSLFPEDIGPAMALYYTEVLVPQFLEEAPVELGELYQKGYTYLRYLTVATNSRKGNFPGDLKLLTAFKEKPSLYGLRLMIPKATFGLRINAWFLFKDRWVTLLKTGELLEPWMSEDLEKYKTKAKTKAKTKTNPPSKK